MKAGRIFNRSGERGSAVFLVVALLAIMVIYLSTNQVRLHHLKRELKLIEAKQVRKFQTPARTRPDTAARGNDGR